MKPKQIGKANAYIGQKCAVIPETKNLTQKFARKTNKNNSRYEPLHPNN